MPFCLFCWQVLASSVGCACPYHMDALLLIASAGVLPRRARGTPHVDDAVLLVLPADVGLQQWLRVLVQDHT